MKREYHEVLSHLFSRVYEISGGILHSLITIRTSGMIGGCKQKYSAGFVWTRLTFVLSCDCGVYATRILSAILVEQSDKATYVLTSDLPKLIGHRKIPILKPSVRKESDFKKKKTHSDE